jgi:hypothetical protein
MTRRLRSSSYFLAALIVASTTLLATSCTGSPKEPDRFLPPGVPIDDHATACEGYLDRAHIQALLGDPTTLTESSTMYSTSGGSCDLYIPKTHRYALGFKISHDNLLYDPQMKDGKKRPGAVIQDERAVAFLDENRTAARAIIRLPDAYVVVFLRQGPFSADRLRQILVIANKIAATVPAPFGTARPTPTSITPSGKPCNRTSTRPGW